MHEEIIGKLLGIEEGARQKMRALDEKKAEMKADAAAKKADFDAALEKEKQEKLDALAQKMGDKDAREAGRLKDRAEGSITNLEELYGGRIDEWAEKIKDEVLGG